jgi:hypothetical protein
MIAFPALVELNRPALAPVALVSLLLLSKTDSTQHLSQN